VSLPQILAELQALLLCWSGHCPVCGRATQAEAAKPDTS
jgi:hypothetical protein